MSPLGFLKQRRLKAIKAQARAAQRSQRWAEGAILWERVQEGDPGNLHALVQVGNMQTELGLFERANEAFSEARASASHEVHGEIGLASVAERRGRWSLALHHWEAAVAAMARYESGGKNWPLTPGQVLLKAAVCRFCQHDFPNAERDLFFAITLQPELRRGREAILLRGRLAGRHDPKAAHRVLRDGSRRFPDDEAILYEFKKFSSTASDSTAAAGSTPA